MTSVAARGGALVALTVVIACTPASLPLVPKVLVIGIDGVRPDVLEEVETPHIDALIAGGLYSPDAQTGSPTVSGPGWSSFLIGVWPEKHQVTSNDFTGNDYAHYPDFLTRLEQIDPTFETMAVVDWRPLGDTIDGGPLISSAVDTLVLLDGYELGWLAADRFGGDVAADLLATSAVDAAFVYLGAPDEMSHQTGAIGSEYRGAIAAADRIVGSLIAAIEARPSAPLEDWLIVLSSDHGRREDGGHGGETREEKTIPFLVSGRSATTLFAESPRIVDVAVTALAHLGIELDPAWALDGNVRGIVPSDAASPP